MCATSSPPPPRRPLCGFLVVGLLARVHNAWSGVVLIDGCGATEPTTSIIKARRRRLARVVTRTARDDRLGSRAATATVERSLARIPRAARPRRRCDRIGLLSLDRSIDRSISYPLPPPFPSPLLLRPQVFEATLRLGSALALRCSARIFRADFRALLAGALLLAALVRDDRPS